MRRTACLLLTLCSAAWAWTPAVSEGGGLRLELPEQAPWTTVDTPRAVAVKLTNLSAGPLTGELRLSGIEPWRVAGGAQPFTLAAGGRSSLSFAVTMGAGAYAALYPLHATARLDGGTTVHTVRIVSAEPPAGAAAQPAVIKLTAPGVAPLAKARPRQVVILPPDGPSYALPAGASRDARSAAVWQPGGTADRGGVRPVINCHPPYNGVKGEIAADYEVELPAGQTITFTTGLAIRDSRADEPLSDGVTFKVLVASEDGKFTEVAAKHSLAKQWDELSADLSRFGGRRVTLRLVANPGPKGDTSCDSGYWGNPLLRAGRPPVSEAPEAARRRSEQALLAARAVLAGRPAGEVAAWRLSGAAGDSGVAVVTGPAGLLDARIAFACAMPAPIMPAPITPTRLGFQAAKPCGRALPALIALRS